MADEAKKENRHRTRALTLGLLVVTFLAWGDDGPIEVLYLALPFLAVAVLLAIETFRPVLLERMPAWARPPWTERAAAFIFVTTSVMRGTSNPMGWLFVVATYLYVRDAHRRGLLTPMEPPAILHGWRRILLAGVILGAFTLAADWEGSFHSSYSSDGDRYTTDVPGQNAWDTGDATIPGVLLLLAVLWAAYDGERRWPWWRFVPVALGLALVLFGVQRAIADASGMPEIGDGYTSFNAAGPPWMLIALTPFYIAAIRFALKGAAVPRDPGKSASKEKAD
jgi:hypothetical protein